MIHKFVRNANVDSNIYFRVANRFDPFNNTYTLLKDPKRGKTLHLIGTTNSSTTLAYRTKKLLESVQPDAIYMQASKEWSNYSRHINVLIQSFRLIHKHYIQRLQKIFQMLHTDTKII